MKNSSELNIGERTCLLQGYDAWSSNQAYLKGGSYRLKATKKIAPWSKVVKAIFGADHYLFHRAASIYRDHRKFIVPSPIDHENVRLVYWPSDKIEVYVWENQTRRGNPMLVEGFAAIAIVQALNKDGLARNKDGWAA